MFSKNTAKNRSPIFLHRQAQRYAIRLSKSRSFCDPFDSLSLDYPVFSRAAVNITNRRSMSSIFSETHEVLMSVLQRTAPSPEGMSFYFIQPFGFPKIFLFFSGNSRFLPMGKRSYATHQAWVPKKFSVRCYFSGEFAAVRWLR